MTELVKGLEAHVYVIGHQNGLIKVGFTANPAKRIQKHRNTSSTHGNPVVQTWISGPHAGAAQNEQALISYCSKEGRTEHGREWFSGISFGAVQAFAETLPMIRASQAQIEQRKCDGDAMVDGFAQLLGIPRKPQFEVVGAESIFLWAMCLDLGDRAAFFNELRDAMEEPDALTQLGRVYAKWRTEVAEDRKAEASA